MVSSRILIVEDESIVALDIKHQLLQMGHDVVGLVFSGETAVQQALALRPDLILMDVRLSSELDGIAASQQILKEFSVPIVYLTAHTDAITLERAKETEPYGYLIKPFDARELKTTVDIALYRHQAKLKEHEYTLRLQEEIAERTRIAGQLRMEELRLRALLDLSLQADNLSEEEIIQLALEQAVNLTESEIGYLHYVNPDQATIELAAWSERTRAQCTVVHDTHYPLEKAGVWADCARLRQPIVHNDYPSLPDRRGYPEGHVPLQRHLSVPVVENDRVVVITGVGNKSTPYDEGDTRQLRLLAETTWQIIRRRRAEQRQREYARELEARNSELDAYAHTVAHDLKNPISIVLGHAVYLNEVLVQPSPDELQRSLVAITQSAEKATHIIDELLLLAGVRQQAVRPVPLDMGAIVEEAERRLAHLVRETGAELRRPAQWPQALGHAPWIEEVWVNYLSNALKYGGCPPVVEVGADLQCDGLVRFWVRDNGRGLSPDEQAQLFVPFARLDHHRAAGNGLGLSIVRRIIDKLGGEVGVESVVGQGTTFYFALRQASAAGVA